MAHTFKCPSCGAPLEPQGSAATVRCTYCSASVIVPPELREPDRPEVSFTSIHIGGGPVRSSQRSIPPAQMREIVDLIRAGNKIGAIKVYRDATGYGLKESKDAVEALEKMLSLDGEESLEELAALFTRSANIPASQTSASHISRWVIGLFIFLALAGTLIPLFFAVIVPALAITTAVQQVNVVETVQVETRTRVAQFPAATPRPTLTPQPSPTPGYADLLLSFGVEGIGPGQFKDARSIAVDGQGNLYVAEYTGGRVQKFDPQGKFILQFLVDAEMPVLGVGVDRQGVVYISQAGIITLHDPQTGEPQGSLNPPPGQFYQHFTFGPAGQIAVVSTSAQSPDDIHILNAAGETVRTISGAFQSQTRSPELDMSLAFDGLGNLYALGSFHDAVFKFDPDGRFVTRFGSQGSEPGQFRSVQGLVADGQGRIYVSDTGQIQVFDSSGRYLDRINRGPTVFFGLTTDAQDNLWVAGRTRVYKFKARAGN